MLPLLQLIKLCIVFIVVFLISRLFIIVFYIHRRRTAVPGNLLFRKGRCVRTLVVLGSGNYSHFSPDLVLFRSDDDICCHLNMA